jgi:hypothetical protein
VKALIGVDRRPRTLIWSGTAQYIKRRPRQIPLRRFLRQILLMPRVARAARQVTDRGMMELARQFRILIRGFHGQIPLVHRVSPIW